MPIRLSAVGITEFKPVSQADLQSFEPVGDDELPGEDRLPWWTEPQTQSHPPIGSPPINDQILTAIQAWVAQQRKAFADLETALAALMISPTGKAAVQITESLNCTYPSELLSKPWDNLMVSDVRLGFPAGCVKVLNEAGVISLEALSSCIAVQPLTRLPKVGKAKAAVILDTYRAFERAVEAARKDAES